MQRKSISDRLSFAYILGMLLFFGGVSINSVDAVQNVTSQKTSVESIESHIADTSAK